jgi:hypothetical protein
MAQLLVDESGNNLDATVEVETIHVFPLAACNSMLASTFCKHILAKY